MGPLHRMVFTVHPDLIGHDGRSAVDGSAGPTDLDAIAPLQGQIVQIAVGPEVNDHRTPLLHLQHYQRVLLALSSLTAKVQAPEPVDAAFKGLLCAVAAAGLVARDTNRLPIREDLVGHQDPAVSHHDVAPLDPDWISGLQIGAAPVLRGA